MAPKKKSAPAAAAAKEKDKEEKPAVYRADLGEAIPVDTPAPTATDKKDK